MKRSDAPILLQPGFPAPDDPEMSRLLGELQGAVGAAWIELEIADRSSGETVRYPTGPEPDACQRHELELKARARAWLRHDAEAAPGGAILRLISSHVDRFLSSRRVHEQAVLLKSALDNTTSSVLLFDSSCQIIYANPPADRLLSRQTEHTLTVPSPSGRTLPLFTRLCQLVDRIILNPGGQPAWRGSFALSDGTLMSCEVIRVALENVSHDLGVLVHLQNVDPLATRILADFCIDYHLSPREEEVIGLILEGLKTAEIAARLGISPHTVKDHVKHVYRKTGTSSRSELLSLMAAVPTGAERHPERHSS